MKRSCYKCGQVRKVSSSKAHFAWLEHSMSKITMTRNEQNKWECCGGFGCSKKES